MESLREGYATPPREPNVTAYFNDRGAGSPCSSTSGRYSGDEGSEKSQAIPTGLIKEQWQFILEQEASLPELMEAVSRCKSLVLETESQSDERKWLVRHLIELRFRVQELKDALENPHKNEEFKKVVLGHHFKVQQQVSSAPRQHCDNCSGIIWSVLQASYICTECGYCCHYKCLAHVIRVCAHVVASEQGGPLKDICPEKGLASQAYKCAECQAPLTFKSNWTEPRLCDYSGLYYCPQCHWNFSSVIPARVLHNWDFEPRKVSQASLQLLQLLKNKPVLNLKEINPKLFQFVQELSIAKKHREDLSLMWQYLSSCRNATNQQLVGHVGSRRHLIESGGGGQSRGMGDLYSMADLEGVIDGSLNSTLVETMNRFNHHIRECEVCKGKGYLCELCGNDEIIFPYDAAAFPCSKCNSVYHRACWCKKNNVCPKCVRIKKRFVSQLQIEDNGDTDIDTAPIL